MILTVVTMMSMTNDHPNFANSILFSDRMIEQHPQKLNVWANIIDTCKCVNNVTADIYPNHYVIILHRALQIYFPMNNPRLQCLVFNKTALRHILDLKFSYIFPGRWIDPSRNVLLPSHIYFNGNDDADVRVVMIIFMALFQALYQDQESFYVLRLNAVL